MFRDLIPRLADRYHVIAPDHLGFGLSDAPAVDELRLHLRRARRTHRGTARPARRAPVRDLRPGLRRADRLAARAADPARSPRSSPRTATATRPVSSRSSGSRCGRSGRDRTRRPRPPCAQALTLDAIRWQYLHGVPDPSAGQPGHLESRPRPGVAARQRPVQLRLFADYATNLAAVPAAARVPAGQRRSRCWRSGAATTRSSGPTARCAFAGPPGAEIHLLDGGHFLLESHLDAAAGSIRGFLGRTTAMTGPLQDQTVLVIGRAGGIARAVARRRP